MKTEIQIIISMLLISCSTSKTSTESDYVTFHEDIRAKIIVKSVDRFSVEFYDLYRFQFYKESKNGIILIMKGDTSSIPINEIVEIDLCDLREFKTVFRESDTTYIGKTPLIYGEQEGLEDNVDTISFRGHFMLYGSIIGENGELLLDFGNNAVEPVFKICRK